MELQISSIFLDALCTGCDGISRHLPIYGNVECRNRKLFCEDLKHFIHSNSYYLAGLVLHLIQRREVCFKLIMSLQNRPPEEFISLSKSAQYFPFRQQYNLFVFMFIYLIPHADICSTVLSNASY